MFVPLRMSVDEAMEEYAELCEQVYDGTTLSTTTRSDRLRKYLQNMMKRKELSVDLKLGQSQLGCRCKGYGGWRFVRSDRDLTLV
jgi:hypothetical protein